MSDKKGDDRKVTALRPQDAARVALTQQQLAIVREVHARLAEAATEWSKVLVLLGVDESRLIGMDLEHGYLALKPPEEHEIEGS